MASSHKWSRRSVRLGIVATVLGGLSYLLQGTAVMSRFDSRRPGLLLLVAGVLLILTGARRRRTPTALAAVGLSVVVLFAYGWATYTVVSEESVEFSSGDVILAGTLLVPNGDGPHPAAVFMHGSGPGPRMGNYAEARALARSGVAVLIYDKRGSGESRGGHYRLDGYTALASDGVAGVEYLRRRSDIDGQRVGLWGTSEGGWTASMAAQELGDPAFLVLVSGGPVTPAVQGVYSLQQRMAMQGHSQDEIDRAGSLSRGINDYYRTGSDREGLVEAFEQTAGEPWRDPFGFGDAPPDMAALTDREQWWIEHMDTDVMPIIRGADYPVLLALGADDPLIPSHALSMDVQSAVEPGADVTVEVFEEATHNILIAPSECSLCIPDGVVGPFRPWFAPGYLGVVSDWVSARVGLAE